ncbi:hypothetical protein LSAT2_011494 [Lamellibrachia satsuma]|nr:hypothetical protein LSAT2_011494 [Lamellibrachia satsuma]
MDTWLKKKEAFESGDVLPPPPSDDEGKAVSCGSVVSRRSARVVWTACCVAPNSSLPPSARTPETAPRYVAGYSRRRVYLTLHMGRWRYHLRRASINNEHKQ